MKPFAKAIILTVSLVFALPLIAEGGVEEQSSGTLNNLRGVWGSSGTDVFAVGESGTILRYDGANWSGMSSGTSEHLTGIWGSSETDVFAIGGNGLILHYDGVSWSEMWSPTTSSLYDIWGNSGSNIFAVGYGGTCIHYDGNSWRSIGGSGFRQIGSP